MSKHSSDGGFAHTKNDTSGKGNHAQDGSLRVTVVTGSTFTGRYAPDGSLNVIIDNSNNHLGTYHPCGALRVTANSGPGLFAANGAFRLPGIA